LVTTPPPTTGFQFGLQNKNSAAERIGQSREAQQRITENRAQVRNTNSDPVADLGLQDRNGASERLGSARAMQQQIVQNHGFEAKTFVKEALTNNTKIINIPVQQRGSLLDIEV
jgi:hypothetical protein